MSESKSVQTGVDPAEARASLDAVRDAQLGMGRQVVIPTGYDAVYGACFGAFVVGVALINAPGSSVALMVVGALVMIATLVTMGALVRWFRRVNGFWISGTTPPRARRAAWAAGIEMLVCVFLGSVAGSQGLWGITALIAVEASVGGYALSRLWMRIYRAEIGAGA